MYAHIHLYVRSMYAHAYVHADGDGDRGDGGDRLGKGDMGTFSVSPAAQQARMRA